jgi:MacB-like periplasmic core domain
MFPGKRKPSDFNAEIEAHLELETERLKERGLSADDARAAACRAFGNVTLAQERFYESGHWIWWDNLKQDIRFGLRTLRRSPAFTAVAVLTLALGIGANSAIFSVVYAVMLRPLPYSDPSRLVMLWQTFPKEGWPEVPFSAADFVDLQKQNRVFQDTAAIFLDKPDYNLTGQGEPERVFGVAVSANLFALLGARGADRPHLSG